MTSWTTIRARRLAALPFYWLAGAFGFAALVAAFAAEWIGQRTDRP